MAKAYITVEHNDDGTKTVVDHKTRTAAHTHGQALRKAGKHVYAHPKEFADRMGLDPRTSKGQGGEYPPGTSASERPKYDKALTAATTPPTRKEIADHGKAGQDSKYKSALAARAKFRESEKAAEAMKSDRAALAMAGAKSYSRILQDAKIDRERLAARAKAGGSDSKHPDSVDNRPDGLSEPSKIGSGGANPHSYSKGDVIPPMKHRETPEEAARYEAHKAASAANKPATTPWSADANRQVDEGDKHAAKTGILAQNPSHAAAAHEAANASSIAKGASNRTSGDRLHTHTVAANAHAQAVQAHTTALAAARTPKEAAVHSEAIKSHRESLAMHSKIADQAANAKSDAKKWADSKLLKKQGVKSVRVGKDTKDDTREHAELMREKGSSSGGSYSHWKGGGK